MRYRKIFFASSLLLLLTACASGIPEPIRQQLAQAPALAEVRAEPERFKNSQVRWGGLILDTETRQESSWVKVIALPLRGNGKPQDADNSPGRFIAVIDRFLEPMLYSRDRRITINGRVLGTHTENIGDFTYEYPIVQVDFHHLWPKDPPPIDNPYPHYWYYDPWWYHPIYYPRHPVRLVPHHR